LEDLVLFTKLNYSYYCYSSKEELATSFNLDILQGKGLAKVSISVAIIGMLAFNNH
jgi:hypothetical protein